MDVKRRRRLEPSPPLSTRWPDHSHGIAVVRSEVGDGTARLPDLQDAQYASAPVASRTRTATSVNGSTSGRWERPRQASDGGGERVSHPKAQRTVGRT